MLITPTELFCFVCLFQDNILPMWRNNKVSICDMWSLWTRCSSREVSLFCMQEKGLLLEKNQGSDKKNNTWGIIFGHVFHRARSKDAKKLSTTDFKRLKKTDKLSVQESMTVALLENRNFEDALKGFVSMRVP